MSIRGEPAWLDRGAPLLIWLMLIAVLLLLAIASSARVVEPNHRAVVLRFGRANRAKGPGLVVYLPGLERVRMVSTSLNRIHGVSLRASTREGIGAHLSVEVLYRIVDPVVALETAPDPAACLLEDLEWMIHHEVARGDLSQLLHGRELLTARLVPALVVGAPATGIHVLDVDITDVEVELSQELLRWMR